MDELWTAEIVLDRLDHAGATLLALPHTGYSTRMSQSNLPIVRDFADLVGVQPDRKPAMAPTPRMVTEMEEAFGWIRLIPADKAVLRRIVGSRALCWPATMRPLYPWRTIATMVGASHEAVRTWHAQGVDLIVTALNRPGLCEASGGVVGPGPNLIRRQLERQGLQRAGATRRAGTFEDA